MSRAEFTDCRALIEGLREPTLVAGANGRVLVVGYESWPFPIPLVADAGRWRFDTAAGVEEVLARRIGRNELAAIRACRTYVYAQKVYASRGHDSKPKGLYATVLRSDRGRHNGCIGRPPTARRAARWET